MTKIEIDPEFPPLPYVQVNQMIAAFRAGIECQRTLPPTAISAMVKQCEAQVQPFAESPLSSLATGE